jgi:hypothetical protein
MTNHQSPLWPRVSIAARWLIAMWMPIAWLTFAGCNAQRRDEESHEHFPPHWPYTIQKAASRLNELIAGEESASREHTIAPNQELVDLIGWLPILAADSDLDRETFDRIDIESTRILARWERDVTTGNFKSRIEEPDVRALIDWLADVCRREQARIEQLEP